jgi:hypothetical protein
MGDYKLIDLKNAKFTELSPEATRLLKSSSGKLVSRHDVIIKSVMEFMPSGSDVIQPKYIFRVYKYSGCSDDVAFGYKYYGNPSIKRGTLEEIEEEMIDAVLGVYLYSIGGIEWEPVK